MPATPTITLTAKLQDFTGATAGSPANPAKLRIALLPVAGQGQVLPVVPGTSNIAQIGPTYYSDTGSGISIKLWGNDVVNPNPVMGGGLTNYYEIAVLDGEGNMVQCGAYQFTGTQTIDLSAAPQITPSPVPPVPPVSGGITQLVGDVTAGPGNGIQTATVVKIQSRAVATTVPVEDAVLVWDTATSIYQVRQLTADDIAAGFSITGFTGGGAVEIGATVTNPAFAASYSSTPASATITNDYPVDTPKALTAPFASVTVTGALVKNVEATTTFTLTAVSTGGITRTATRTLQWLPLTFGGVGTPGATGATASGNNAALVGATGTLANNGLGDTFVGENFPSYSPVAQKVYLLLTGGTHTFKDNVTGFAFPFNAPTALTFVNQHGQNVSMYLYESTNTVTQTLQLQVVT